MLKKQLKKEEKAITLIALVISIIVLLILAGVTIAALSGDNGILSRAAESKTKSQESQVQENIKLAYNSALIGGYAGETTTFKDRLQSELENTYGVGKVTVEEDGSGYIVTIEGKGTYTIDQNGSIGKAIDSKYIPTATYIVGSTVTATEDENGQGTITKDSTAYVIVTISIQEGTISSVTPGTGLTLVSNDSGKYVYSITKDGNYTLTIVSNQGTENEYTKNLPISVQGAYEIANMPATWTVASSSNTGNEWYAYTNIATDTVVKANEPKLVGNMHAIKYTGTTTGSKWANAITSDGSMFVWIPRYAYKITYTDPSSRAAGTIDVAFIDTNNQFLNSTDTGTIITNPAEITFTNGVQNQWLVHPAFTTNAANGGGWDNELTGLWVGKFEATGSSTKDSDGNVTAATISVLPGTSALCFMRIKDQYKFAQTATFGETATLNSHMVKNSEWGAMGYLAYSKYGRNGEDVTNQSGGLITGGTSTPASIYSSNYGQSTTNNAYGVYGLRGGAYEYVASYVNYANNSTLQTNGGILAGDLYGATDNEKSTSTRYKTVYTASGTSASASYNLLEATNIFRGDGVWETSTSYTGSTSWHNEGYTVYSYFPNTSNPFFVRGGGYASSNAGLFYFNGSNGHSHSHHSFRVVLAP